jgi:adenine-specific DNA-methyltransferase
MAKLDDLIGQVSNDALREELTRAARELRRRKKFGLVFEEHIPEVALLHDFPLKPGMTAYRRQDINLSEPVRVEEVRGDTATVHPIPTGESVTVPSKELFALKRFGEAVYPTLVPVDTVKRGGDRPFHAVINGENYHALQLLTFLYEGKVDCMYLDPPYNTGARDWKYNNNYVDSNDVWRHSKWLSMMERRLRLAKRLLSPNGILVVTIDEHEVHHLGVLLEQVFPEYERQMVTIVNNPKGVTRPQGGLSRVEEYAVFCFPEGTVMEGRGDDFLSAIKGRRQETSTAGGERPRWQGLLHSGQEHRREDRESMFYPVLIDEKRRAVVGAGKALLPVKDDAGEIVEWPEPDLDAKVDGHTAVWPIRENGAWGRWYIGAATLRRLAEKGYVALGRYDEKRRTWALRYLYKSLQEQIEDGRIEVINYDKTKNVVDVRYTEIPKRRIKTVWHRSRHDAGSYGADLLGEFLGGRRFPFPKSLYAVRDALAAVVGDNPSALILDFFAGSGTTLHATALLNAEDGGRRRCVLVTNNEVDEKVAAELASKGHFPGDGAYEERGIFEAVTRPRCKAALTGKRPDGKSVKGKYLNERPFAEGFAENCEFFRLGYLDPDEVELGLELAAILPALWLAAGGTGKRPNAKPKGGFLLPSSSPFGVLLREGGLRKFASALEERPDVTHVWLVCDSVRAFADMRSALPATLQVSMLYSDYLRNFLLDTGGPDED